VAPVSGPAIYLLSASAEVAIITVAMLCWCNASRWVVRLSLFGLMAHFIMFSWWHAPSPYNAFMVAYNAYPYIIRSIELVQVGVLVFWTPPVQVAFAALRRLLTKDKEPPKWSGHRFQHP